MHSFGTSLELSTCPHDSSGCDWPAAQSRSMAMLDTIRRGRASGCVVSRQPTIYLIAGCNGAGKTTFAKEFLPKEVKCLRFLNADKIARGLSPLDPSAGAVKAARLLLREVHEAIRDGHTFRTGINYQRRHLRSPSSRCTAPWLRGETVLPLGAFGGSGRASCARACSQRRP